MNNGGVINMELCLIPAWLCSLLRSAAPDDWGLYKSRFWNLAITSFFSASFKEYVATPTERTLVETRGVVDAAVKILRSKDILLPSWPEVAQCWVYGDAVEWIPRYAFKTECKRVSSIFVLWSFATEFGSHYFVTELTFKQNSWHRLASLDW